MRTTRTEAYFYMHAIARTWHVSYGLIDTLSSVGSSSYTYSESGNRTISLAAGGFIDGSYSDTETMSPSYTISDNTSIVLGPNGTISGGTIESFTTDTYTDSQSYYESGAASTPDPEGGPYFGADFTQSSVTTSYAFSSNVGTISLGALGTISGGGNSFTFIQSDYNSLSMSTPETDTASYTENMSGTETYGVGGTVSGGSDSFSWYQNASDLNTIIECQTNTSTLASSQTDYEIWLTDTLYDTMTDNGSDVLGASDSILSNGDNYTILDFRDVIDTIFDQGSGQTPYYILTTQGDLYQYEDTGTSTLSASGHTLATDSITYLEESEDNATDSQSYAGGSFASGGAYDSYYDLDYSTITNSNGVTTSDDTFTLEDSHTINGADGGTSVNSSVSESWYDGGFDSNYSVMYGTDTPTNDVLSFVETDSNGDTGVSTESTTMYYGSGGNVYTNSSYEGGTYISNPETSGYNSLTSTSENDASWNEGTLTMYGSTYHYNIYNSNNGILEYTVTGPPPSTTTLVNTNSVSDSDTYGPNGAYGSIPSTGNAVNAPAAPADHLGSYAIGGVHNGTQNRGFDTSQGLISALGGQGVHGLEFTGPEDQPIYENGTIAVNDYDGTLENGGPPNTPWESHPTSVGYVRGNQSTGTSAGTAGAAMDSGTRDGTPTDELNRLGAIGSTSEENPTSAQPGPTPRSQQNAAVPNAASATAAAISNPTNSGNRDNAGASAGAGSSAVADGGALASATAGGGGEPDPGNVVSGNNSQSVPPKSSSGGILGRLNDWFNNLWNQMTSTADAPPDVPGNGTPQTDGLLPNGPGLAPGAIPRADSPNLTQAQGLKDVPVYVLDKFPKYAGPVIIEGLGMIGFGPEDAVLTGVLKASQYVLKPVMAGGKKAFKVFKNVCGKLTDLTPDELKKLENALDDARAANAKAPKGATTSTSQLQKKFKHAGDFGVAGNPNKANLEAFDNAIQSHLQSPGTQKIAGTYRGDPVNIHVDPTTGLTVITDPAGNFISGWKLSAQQLWHVLNGGKLGGG